MRLEAGVVGYPLNIESMGCGELRHSVIGPEDVHRFVDGWVLVTRGSIEWIRLLRHRILLRCEQRDNGSHRLDLWGWGARKRIPEPPDGHLPQSTDRDPWPNRVIQTPVPFHPRGCSPRTVSNDFDTVSQQTPGQTEDWTNTSYRVRYNPLDNWTNVGHQMTGSSPYPSV